jgi:hypothetical protein
MLDMQFQLESISEGEDVYGFNVALFNLFGGTGYDVQA